MKLLYRTAFTQVLVAIPMVILGTVLGFFAVRHAVTNELDEQFEHYAEHLQEQLKAGRPLPDEQAPDRLVALLPMITQEASFRDTILYNAAEEEDIPWRIARFPVVMADSSQATLQLGSATVEHEDLITVLALLISGVLLLLLVVNILVNRWLNQRLWSPFHRSLETIRSFRMDAGDATVLPSTPITEFSELNATLTTMMAKARKDFVAQKRFTEEAAHEMQTPLAIIQGKLDQLIQSEAINETNADVIESLFKARERMGRTVNNMLLLARIGNQQFPPAVIDWEGIFKEQINALEDVIEKRQLQVSVKVNQSCTLQLHHVLAEVLVANLVRNAVQHNVQAGHVNVVIGTNGFLLANTGEILTVDPSTLFDRFAKADPSSASTGLGLSMVKEICDNGGLRLLYTEVAGTHTVVVER